MFRKFSYKETWLRGFKSLFLICLLLLAGIVGGVLLVSPLILIAELLGYKPDETLWFWIVAALFTSFAFGQAMPVIGKYLIEQDTPPSP